MLGIYVSNVAITTQATFESGSYTYYSPHFRGMKHLVVVGKRLIEGANARRKQRIGSNNCALGFLRLLQFATFRPTSPLKAGAAGWGVICKSFERDLRVSSFKESP